MKKNTYTLLAFVSILLTPSFFLNAQSADLTYFEDLFTDVGGLFTILTPVLVAIALAVFIWGLVIFIAKSGEDKAREEGKNKMIWGIVALFVIVAVVGIVELLITIFGVGTGSGLTPPALLGGWFVKKHA